MSRQLAQGTVFTAVQCGGVPCEWIRTECQAPSKLAGAVYFHMHGGGHYRGSSRVAAPVCSHLSSLAGIDCLSVNYRLAPEHKWPIAVDDAFCAYTWLVSPEGGAVSPDRVVVGGDSAGGDLCFSLIIKLRDHAPELLPAGAIGLSPWVDLTQSGATFATNADSGVANCDKSYLDHWSAEYLGSADGRAASPLFSDLDGLPPMLIQCGGGETMLGARTVPPPQSIAVAGNSLLNISSGHEVPVSGESDWAR
jgi:acetyl esterase/lipase